jgi:16S rRNA (guanine1207-N2)-methyltransferase
MTHYFSKKQDSDLDLKTITIRLKEIRFELYSGSGVFSKGKLDRGSELLISDCRLEGKTLLDLGCGIGAVGISLKLLHPHLEITMSELNERAIMLAKKSIRKLRLDIQTVKSDLYQKLGRYDMILSNPPQAAGKELSFRIISEAKGHLNPGGTLQIVARHNKGGEVLEKKMSEVFGNVSQVSIKSGFRIYLSKAP